MELKVVDVETGGPVGVGERGELLMKGPNPTILYTSACPLRGGGE